MANPSQFFALINAQAAQKKLPWWLLYGVIEQESGFDPDAVSPAGAVGLMQLMPSSFPGWSPESLRAPGTNVQLGAEYLAGLIAAFTEEAPDEAIKFGLASYNGGIGYVLSAQRLVASDGGNAHSWASIAQELPHASCDGEHCDYDQIRDYVAAIWAKYEARRIAPPPQAAQVEGKAAAI